MFRPIPVLAGAAFEQARIKARRRAAVLAAECPA